MIKTIPLNKLVQSPRNVRRHSDPAADAELKASIAAHGLLQNLIVRPAAKGKFEVEAGELRRRAMLALANEKLLARDHVTAAEATIEAIERECQDIRARPPVIAPELKAEAGMVLVLSRDGSNKRRTTLSKRLVDELAMQRRDVLAPHVASDPGLALDVMVFTLADADTHDWWARAATTLRAPVPVGPITGLEAKDASASGALAELRSGLDESWRAGTDATSRFDLYPALADDSRASDISSPPNLAFQQEIVASYTP